MPGGINERTELGNSDREGRLRADAVAVALEGLLGGERVDAGRKTRPCTFVKLHSVSGSRVVKDGRAGRIHTCSMVSHGCE